MGWDSSFRGALYVQDGGVDWESAGMGLPAEAYVAAFLFATGRKWYPFVCETAPPTTPGWNGNPVSSHNRLSMRERDGVGR
ncbi:SWI/SNF family DNA-dependent ATPase Ris1 [Anopheles sinensis]|uniref:SWI/SNF family DNA-dependent ATPase Ris1 n=1 Tax=Anopheles sinensis TaxID=74873 RepID=A0A084VUH4_ANOSI|nr:SWI/SNF family DNA-dependent ATPase Ris1 [Anopheles sinensis]